MNPYVYSRNRKSLGQDQPPAVPIPHLGTLVKEVFTSNISALVAFAFVFLAAGSAAAITGLAYPEISQDNTPVLTHVFSYNQTARVLGASTTAVSIAPIIQDSQLEAAAAVAGKISAKPLSYDSSTGRWDYTISYTLSDFTGSATLAIGTYTIQQGITASGSAETGNILKPNMVYHVILWPSDSSGNQVGVLRYELKTPKAKSSDEKSVGPVCAQPQLSNSTASSSPSSMPSFCIKKDDGTSQCASIACMPPFRRPMMGSNDHSTSTPPNMFGRPSTTPDSMRMGDMPPPGSASGTMSGFMQPPHPK